MSKVNLSDLIEAVELHSDEAFSLNDERHKENLLIALQGKGAFRRFKDIAIYLGMVDNRISLHKISQPPSFLLQLMYTRITQAKQIRNLAQADFPKLI